MRFLNFNQTEYWQNLLLKYLSNYLKKVSPLLNKGGILISDNVLWHGKVLDENRNYDKTTKLIDEFNKNIIKDKTLQSIMLPLRDGISISVKL